MSDNDNTQPVDKQAEFQRKQIDLLIEKVRKILPAKSDAQLATLLRASYEEAMQAHEAGALPLNVAHNVIQDFLVKLTTC